VVTNSAGLPESVTDPIGATTQLGYTGNFNGLPGDAPTSLESVVQPEGNKVVYTRDGRNNITQTRWVAKVGSGLADIVTSATFPATCTYRKTCNKPTSVTDANGKTTDFTYDNSHGGVLTETRPAPSTGAPRPQTRYTYAQRYAWIKNSSGGYSQAASPVWVLAAEASCRTSAWTGSACASSNDEVITSYDYGPNSGPNNLLLRGKVVTADGVSRRTCFFYDGNGNRISQTSARAGLTTCS
jgi:YD repeat-containing protein